MVVNGWVGGVTLLEYLAAIHRLLACLSGFGLGVGS